MEAIGAVGNQETKGSEGVFSFNNLKANPNPVSPPTRETARRDPPQVDTERVRQETQARIERIAQAMDNYVKSVQRGLEIQVHEETGNIMVKVISKEDGHVVREIPSEEMLNLAARMEQMVGILFDENV